MNIERSILQYFAALIFNKLGIVYNESEYFQLESRLRNICTQLGLESATELQAMALGGLPQDVEMLLLDVATNNETSFFRDTHIFQQIKTIACTADYWPDYRIRPLSIWSAGCSYGQEPYSLAFLLEDCLAAMPLRDYRITATDISNRALEKAKSAIYSQLEVQRGLSALTLARCMQQSSDSGNTFHWMVKPEYRRKIDFKKINLLESLEELGTFDLILCRNVLIYQNLKNKQIILQKLHNRLEPGGFLILGAAESLVGIDVDLKTVRLGSATVFRKDQHVQAAS